MSSAGIQRSTTTPVAPMFSNRKFLVAALAFCGGCSTTTLLPEQKRILSTVEDLSKDAPCYSVKQCYVVFPGNPSCLFGNNTFVISKIMAPSTIGAITSRLTEFEELWLQHQGADQCQPIPKEQISCADGVCQSRS